MNTEDYVSLEVAKLLKEKGFREPFNAIYYVNRSGNSSLQIMFCLNEFEYLSKHNDGFQYEYLAPSLYEAQKWLRNKHQLHISVGMCSGAILPMQTEKYVMNGIFGLLVHITLQVYITYTITLKNMILTKKPSTLGFLKHLN